MTGASTGDILLWVVFPYVTFAVFVVGSVWRYRYDKFGWTTRSSELYEKNLLRFGSPCSTSGCCSSSWGTSWGS